MEEQKREEDAVQAEPELLYHYTTQPGLIGILNEKSIWATHIAYLNDSSEFRHGLEIIRHHIRTLKIDPSRIFQGDLPATQVEIFERTLRELMGQVLGFMDEVDVFVTSIFDSSVGPSSHPGRDPGDNLEQWRAYSGNAGVSIGFDKERLSNHVGAFGENPAAPIACGPCSYD